MHDVLQDGVQLIRSAREGITTMASALHVERPSLLTETIEPKAETKEPAQETVRPEKETTPVSGVSDAETLQYQVDNIVNELVQLETLHLPAGGRIMGKSCDCIAKHSRIIKALAQETIPIAARQGKDSGIYSQLAEWAKEMQKIGTKVAVDSGQFAERYRAESGEASKFRKAIESGKDCPTCGEPKRLSEFLKQKEAKDA